MEVEHAQVSDTTYMNPANTRKVGQGSEIKEGVVWRWGKGGSLFWGSRSSSFGRNILLE